MARLLLTSVGLVALFVALCDNTCAGANLDQYQKSPSGHKISRLVPSDSNLNGFKEINDLGWPTSSESIRPSSLRSDATKTDEPILGDNFKDLAKQVTQNKTLFDRFVPAVAKYIKLARRYNRWAGEYKKLSAKYNLDSVMDEFIAHYAKLDSIKYSKYSCPLTDVEPGLDAIKQIESKENVTKKLKELGFDYVFDILENLIDVLESRLKEHKTNYETGITNHEDEQFYDAAEELPVTKDQIEQAIARVKFISANKLRKQAIEESKTLVRLYVLYSMHVDGLSPATMAAGYIGSIQYRIIMSIFEQFTPFNQVANMLDIVSKKALGLIKDSMCGKF